MRSSAVDIGDQSAPPLAPRREPRERARIEHAQLQHAVGAWRRRRRADDEVAVGLERRRRREHTSARRGRGRRRTVMRTSRERKSVFLNLRALHCPVSPRHAGDDDADGHGRRRNTTLRCGRACAPRDRASGALRAVQRQRRPLRRCTARLAALEVTNIGSAKVYRQLRPSGLWFQAWVTSMRRRLDTTLRQRGNSHFVATTRQRPRWPSPPRRW